MHHEIVLGAADLCASRFHVSSKRTVLLGFSQPVGLNYRLVATHPDRFAGVIGICGGIPRDWEDPGYHPVSSSILHIARDEDEYYPNDVVATFPDRLRARAANVEFHLLPGRHRFPSSAADIIQPWLRRVTG
jgi:predicted esterase